MGSERETGGGALWSRSESARRRFCQRRKELESERERARERAGDWRRNQLCANSGANRPWASVVYTSKAPSFDEYDEYIEASASEQSPAEQELHCMSSQTAPLTLKVLHEGPALDPWLPAHRRWHTMVGSVRPS